MVLRPLTWARTVKSMIKAGAAGLHIEDQVGAKRCGHRPNKAIVSKEEMVDRIRAAVDAKTDPDFVIMARTDALAVEGLDAAIERAQAYVEAGAEMLFPEAITELAMYRQFCRCGAGANPRQHYRIWRNTAVYHRRITQRPCRNGAVPAFSVPRHEPRR
ncbi:methylisocitrate lyase [Escherichia coli]|uniref:Methylisocitrate lyase n=1 Tax=Escherichia coli TaxID=562 RepID=A0A376ZM19_ECOLX|nr:methylisocitrate lyase [Escherichia coli]